jgi:hypothetical protein
MANDLVPFQAASPEYQRARASLRVGRRARFSASVKVTDRGLVAIGVLVSSILLSTAVLVRTAQREYRPS